MNMAYIYIVVLYFSVDVCTLWCYHKIFYSEKLFSYFSVNVQSLHVYLGKVVASVCTRHNTLNVSTIPVGYVYGRPLRLYIGTMDKP